MGTAEQTSVEMAASRTRLFARVIGPFLVVATATALVRAPQLWAQVSDYAADPLWLWTSGAFTLLAGLIVVALHPYWRGAAAACVSVIGWLTTLKGFLLVAFPAASISLADAAMGSAGWWQASYVVFAAVGLYLTYVGWMPEGHRPRPGAVGEAQELPRAA